MWLKQDGVATVFLFLNRKKDIMISIVPRIEMAAAKKLIGTRLKMSLSQYRVGELWKVLMPRRKEIVNNLSNDLIALTLYEPGYFTDFKPANEFEKWAAVEVADFDHVPQEMETFVLSSGLYAVFEYKGLSTDTTIYQYIFGTWLPGSDYELDDRPHLEVLGAKYKNNDSASEEEIWIPVKSKN